MKNILVKFAFLAAGVILGGAPSAHAQAIAYTSDTNIADFTARISSYATLSDFGGGDVSAPFTPTSAELAADGYRVYDGTATGTGLATGNNWILASFSSPVWTIMVFPNIDHTGAENGFDGYQYSIAGSNDGVNWTMLYDTLTVTGSVEPYTIATYAGTPPLSVNNVLTPGTGPGGVVGYEAQFTFSTAYQYYAFGASTEANNSGNSDQELSAVGAVSIVTTSVNTAAANNLIFNNTANTLVEHVLDWSGDTPSDITFPITNPMLQSTNILISNSAVYPEYVVGTPFAPSHCFDRPGNNLPGTVTTDNCSLYEDQCYNSMFAPSEFNCPITTTGFINVSDIFDPQTTKPPIAPNTTAVIIHFHPASPTDPIQTWTPFGSIPEATGAVNPACTNANGTSSSVPPVQCDLSNLIDFVLSGDQTTATGKSHKNSMFISAYNVPMLESLVSANGTPVNTPGAQGAGTTWFNTGSLNLDFKVNPGGCPFPFLATNCPSSTFAVNDFQPAPVAGEIYGVDAPPSVLAAPAAGTSTVGQVDFNTNPVVLNNGVHVLYWEAFDNVGILEQNMQLIPVAVNANCPDGSVALSGSCYTTTLFSAKIGVDTVAPVVTITSPTDTTYALNQPVTAKYTCVDPSPSSGIKPIVSSPNVAVGGAINTSSTGPQTFTVTCTDVAGNTTQKTVTYTVAYPNATHSLVKIGNAQVETGKNLTYGIFLLNYGPGAAYGIDIKDVLPKGTSFLSAMYGEVAFACAQNTCSLPTQGAACPLNGTTVTCAIPTMPSLSAVGVKLVVKVTASAGSKISNTATETGFNTSTKTGNSTSNTVTTTVTK